MKTIDLKTVDSTNLYIKRAYQNFDDMTFVSSAYQTLGHGRNNNNWTSEKGTNLLFSLFISNKSIFSQYPALSMLSAYTILEVLESYGIANVSIKWPNDVYVNDSKICGILLESITKIEMECLIIGVGLNVNQKVFDGSYKVKPTSMSLEMNKGIDLIKLKTTVYQQFEKNIQLLKSGKSFLDEIRKHNYLLNKEGYVDIDGKKEKIKVLGINDDYSLKLADEINLISTIEWIF